MKKKLRLVVTLAVISIFAAGAAFANQDACAADGNIVVLRQGLLGAGTGGRGDAVWKGALIGMGVNVVGGALLDILTTPSGNGAVTYVTSRPQSVTQYVVVDRPAARPDPYASGARRIYKAGYRAGYRQGYRDGYGDAMYGWGAY
jgi:hypothetical protein